MTALQEYERLEAAGLWRASPEDQRRDVIVSIGEASLTITDTRDRPLAHWSLAAIARANKSNDPAIFHPDGSPGETLELGEDEDEMIAAIDKLRRVVEARRPKPGRLRYFVVSGSAIVMTLAAVFWLPEALMRHTVSVVPDAKRAEIGEALLGRIFRVTGQPCNEAISKPVLAKLSTRMFGAPNKLLVLRSGVNETAHLPGGTVLMNRSLVEDWEDPDVAAGFLVAERVRMQSEDTLQDLLDHAGFWSSMILLTTGDVPNRKMESYAEQLLTEPLAPIDPETLVQGFAEAKVRSTPYAYAVDISGETTLPLIEADPMAGTDAPPVLNDSDWVRLQGICGG